MDFSELQEKKANFVVLFCSETCSPCQLTRELLSHIEKDFPSIDFSQLYIDRNFKSNYTQMIQSTPTTILYQAGVPTDVLIGLKSRAEIHSRLSRAYT